MPKVIIFPTERTVGWLTSDGADCPTVFFSPDAPPLFRTKSGRYIRDTYHLFGCEGELFEETFGRPIPNKEVPEYSYYADKTFHPILSPWSTEMQWKSE